MNKLEELIAATKLGELIDKKEDEAQWKKVLWVLAIIGAIAAIAGIVLNAILPGNDYVFGENEVGDISRGVGVNPQNSDLDKKNKEEK